MSTEPETTQDAEPGTPGADTAADAPEPTGEHVDRADARPGDGDGDGNDSGDEGTEPGDGKTAEGAEPGDGTAAEGTGSAEGAAQVSEAAAELAAQRLERERIERRKAEKQAPIEAGGKLSGTAADLLAAVRAVESGEKPVATAFREPDPAPRRAAPEPARRPQPIAAQAAPAPGAAPEAVAAVRALLAGAGAPETLAAQVVAVLGEGSDDRLREDPWQLLRVPGVRPEQADGFARALLGAECGPDDERRGTALTVWLLEQAAVAGHTALDASALVAALSQRSVPDPDAAVQSALAEGEALVFQDAPDTAPPTPAAPDDTEEPQERPVRILIGLERYALAEESLADGLARLMNSVPRQDGSADAWERAAASAPRSAGELIRAAAAHGLVLHTGGEASRSEAAAVLHAARALGLRGWAAAHTAGGRDGFAAGHEPADGAAEHPADGPATEAATVAGLLSGSEGPGRDADGALDLDVLVVLDAPQLDVETAAMLVESLPDGARLVQLAGDPGALGGDRHLG
ncbi:helix-hairpin-helix domain-containing protein, partial [Streptomyces sp. NPDC058398]|uniref:helix-hairpin-helix domain-containing protein n=1 Tax=Streptomyces sp. NPDC058398 TaxID=3346479 RepID=UPI003662201A